MREIDEVKGEKMLRNLFVERATLYENITPEFKSLLRERLSGKISLCEFDDRMREIDLYHA